MRRQLWAAHRRAILLAALAFCAAASAASFAAPRTALDGLLWDAALAARARIVAAPERTDVAVIALDEASLAEPELAGLPRALFAPHWAVLLDGLSDARAIGFDIIFAYSANRLFPDYERDFLTGLDRVKDKVVLGRTLATLPAPPYVFAAGALDSEDAVASVELVADGDDVIRRANAFVLDRDGGRLPSFAAAVLRRAGVTMPDRTILLPPRHPERIPTYALADVLRCAAGHPAALRAAFAGKVVLIGTTLREEERKTTAARFIGDRPAAAALLPCNLAPLAPTDPGSGAVPGVHAHAVAVESVWHGFAAAPAPQPLVVALTGAAAVGGLLLGFLVTPLAAALGVLAGLAALFQIETFAAVQSTWLPTGVAMVALVIGAPYAAVVRGVLEGRLQTALRAAFARYVSPLVVEPAAVAGAPSIGGVARTITVMFADLSGFTALSQRLPPDALLEATNAYLAVMADEVEAAGGYVDKFIGDSVMAIWNAPRADPRHAQHAVIAAQRILKRIVALAVAAREEGRPAMTVKIAIHSGEAVVGNVGSKSRLNYTAIGETVNIAARLERAGEPFDAAIVVSEATARLVMPAIPLRHLGEARLRGIDAPVVLYAP